MLRNNTADKFPDFDKEQKVIKAFEAKVWIDNYLLEVKQTRLDTLVARRRLEDRNLLSIQQLQEDINRIRSRKQKNLQKLEQYRKPNVNSNSTSHSQ